MTEIDCPRCKKRFQILPNFNAMALNIITHLDQYHSNLQGQKKERLKKDLVFLVAFTMGQAEIFNDRVGGLIA